MKSSDPDTAQTLRVMCRREGKAHVKGQQGSKEEEKRSARSTGVRVESRKSGERRSQEPVLEAWLLERLSIKNKASRTGTLFSPMGDGIPSCHRQVWELW